MDLAGHDAETQYGKESQPAEQAGAGSAEDGGEGRTVERGSVRFFVWKHR